MKLCEIILNTKGTLNFLSVPLVFFLLTITMKLSLSPKLRLGA